MKNNLKIKILIGLSYEGNKTKNNNFGGKVRSNDGN